jgi:hypothetical protein
MPRLLLQIALLVIFLPTAALAAPELVISNRVFSRDLRVIEHTLPLSCKTDCTPFAGAFDSQPGSEILLLHQKERKAFTLNSHSNGLQVVESLDFPWSALADTQLSRGASGDFNGDSVDEIIAPTNDPAKWVLLTPTVSGWEIKTLAAGKSAQTKAQLLPVRKFSALQPPDEPAHLLVEHEDSAGADLFKLSPSFDFQRVWQWFEKHTYLTGPARVRRQSSILDIVYNSRDIYEHRFTEQFGRLRFPIGALESFPGFTDAIGGDFNGDGFLDVLLKRKFPLGIGIMLGGEAGLLPQQIGGSLEGKEPLFALDLNGDGLDDLIVADNETKEKSVFIVTTPEIAPPVVPNTMGDVLQSVSSEQQFFDNIHHLLETESHWGSISSVERKRTHQHIRVLWYPRVASNGQPVDVGARLADRLTGPYVCDGFAPRQFLAYGGQQNCPVGYAFMAIDDGGRDGRSGTRFDNYGTCCRLPREDIIDTSKPGVVAELSCPDNHIATKFIRDLEAESEKLYCLPINTHRYTLAKPQPGFYWGIGSSQGFVDAVFEARLLPLSILLGVQRHQRNSIGIDGCVPKDIGALVTTRLYEDYCGASRFSVLLEKIGDQTQPVQMLRECKNIPDPFDPTRGCP